MKRYFVINPGVRGVEVNVGVGDGRRRVMFNHEGVSEALSAEEYHRLIAMRAFNHYAIVDDVETSCLVGDIGDTEVLPADENPATAEWLRQLRAGATEPPVTPELEAEGRAWAEANYGVDEALPPEPESLADILERVGADLAEPGDEEAAPVEVSLVERFRKGDQEARVRFVEDGKHSHAELLELFNVEASWRKSRKVLDALDKALGKAARGKSVEEINREMFRNSAPPYQGE